MCHVLHLHTKISCKYAFSANYIEHIDKGFREVKISDDYEKAIWELSKDSDLLTKLVNSVDPSIYGYEDIKTAILLQLFSGIPKIAPDKAWLREDIHIMMIGDPGIAKSQLLRYVLQIAPRANFSSGLGSTKAGLTASAVKDELKNGSWTIEAGVLPMTNEGVVCADEIDKMREEDRSGLHEAMEQQTVTVIKAGLNMTLSAKCSILAVTNPKDGRFNDYDSIAEQINMPPPLLPRFDLIFILTDKPNEEIDRKIANHILKTHKVSTYHTSAQTLLAGNCDPDPLMVSLYPYNKKADFEPGKLDYFEKPYVEPELMRQYIAYSRKNIFPELSYEIHEMLTELYIGLRRHNYGSEGKKLPISITPRQLEGLIRLSEAAARVRLSNVVTEDDARVAISLVRDSLMNVGVDSESGVIDIDKILIGQTHSQREKVRMVFDVITEYQDVNHSKKIPIIEIIKGMVERGVPDTVASDYINKMIKRGNLARVSSDHVMPME